MEFMDVLLIDHASILFDHSRECNSGFAGDGFICENANEFFIGSHSCDNHAICNDNTGFFVCTSSDGFEDIGYFYKDANECTTSGHNFH